jgi:hypothetical protein
MDRTLILVKPMPWKETWAALFCPIGSHRSENRGFEDAKGR